MDNTLISIIIPCYNYGHFLPATIQSVIDQTYKNWECIIINDGSTDNTQRVAEAYMKQESRIKVIHQQNKGRCYSRNRGIKESNGDYIQFLDADDLLEKSKFEKQLAIFRKEPALDILYSNFDFFYEDPDFVIIPKNESRRVYLEEDYLTDFVLNWGINGLIIPIHCPLFKKEAITNHKIFFDETIEAREDWLFWIQLALAGCNIKFHDDIMAYYRKHEKSTVHNPLLMFTDSLRAVFKAYEFIPQNLKAALIDQQIPYFVEQYNYQINRYDQLSGSFTYKLGSALLYPWRVLKRVL
jgi:glycosyltransferase involved in cell wall biosynthesis